MTSLILFGLGFRNFSNYFIRYTVDEACYMKMKCSIFIRPLPKYYDYMRLFT